MDGHLDEGRLGTLLLEGNLGRRREASTWNVANGLTALRIVLVPVFGWLLLSGSAPSWRAGAALVFAVAVLTDRLDGELARRHGLETDVGRIADPIADKALIGMALVGLSLLGELPWWVTAVVAAREIGVTVMRLVVIRRAVLLAGRGGKAKTALQAVAIIGYLLPLPAPGHVVAGRAYMLHQPPDSPTPLFEPRFLLIGEDGIEFRAQRVEKGRCFPVETVTDRGELLGMPREDIPYLRLLVSRRVYDVHHTLDEHLAMPHFRHMPGESVNHKPAPQSSDDDPDEERRHDD